jgi:hypothetical protein
MKDKIVKVENILIEVFYKTLINFYFLINPLILKKKFGNLEFSCEIRKI